MEKKDHGLMGRRMIIACILMYLIISFFRPTQSVLVKGQCGLRCLVISGVTLLRSWKSVVKMLKLLLWYCSHWLHTVVTQHVLMSQMDLRLSYLLHNVVKLKTLQGKVPWPTFDIAFAYVFHIDCDQVLQLFGCICCKAFSCRYWCCNSHITLIGNLYT